MGAGTLTQVERQKMLTYAFMQNLNGVDSEADSVWELSSFSEAAIAVGQATFLFDVLTSLRT
ncbi:hypothetical protein FQ186_14100 [Pseudomonas sp. ANT_H14]|uniref:hypothetical protein n=1 Tax=unclassified Pseudomonas TaxID=196821 RepID=UPI0011EEFAE5|nr:MULTISPECIES: hypothetical protein [unclassified Pseudomonas]KAA0945613.1 hypothetical protein FQ182_17150 [Pseudomonas sp. ANT_H4]KAA0951779.1 hypothetical protein FQ186_14100 [Pseudomonas sp. ANT_H14]